jgi:saccharopine dehydrogenase (NAD+, L-lysine-forming)
MKVLVLGCGEVGETALRDLHAYGPFDEVTVATRTLEKARAVMEDLDCGPRVSALPLDLAQPVDLAALMRPFDVVVNCIGPNYRHEVRVARAAIAAGVDLVDLNDDYETTLEMLDLDGAAREAGVTVVLGLGASPGVNNVLVRAAADQLTTVEEIRTAWVMSGSDPGGPALAYHLLHSLSGRALTVAGGRLVEVQSFADGAERIEFPQPVGTVEVFHVGHPAPITLWRTFPDAHHVDDKASFNVPEVNRLVRTLGRLVREAPAAIQVGGRTVDPMDFAAAYLHRRTRALDVPRQGALRVSVTGLKGARRRTVVFSSAGRLARGTGIPAAIGACMLAEGAVRGAGVRPPEACLDATDFLYELFTRRHVAELNGWVEEAPERAAARAC